MKRHLLLAIASALLVSLPAAHGADEVDVLGLASRLSTKPTGLQKVIDQLGGGKEEVKKPAPKEEKGYYAVYVWWPGQYPDKSFWAKRETRAEAETAAKDNGWVSAGVGKYVIEYFPAGKAVPAKLP